MLFRRIFFTCGIILLASVFGLAQKQTPPEGGTPKDFNLPKKQTQTLDNGTGVTLVSYGKLPKVTLRVVFQTGNINEAADEIWLADLTGDLMKEGTTTRNAEEIAQEAARMGGEVNISVGPDQTTVSGTVLSEFAPQLVALLADIVQNPLFPESELDRLKNDMIRNVTLSKTQPRSIAFNKFRQLMYPDHPYGRVFPTEEMIKGYTIEQIRGFYETNFGAKRADIYIVGRYDQAEVQAAIRQAFGEWRSGSEAITNIPSPQSVRAVHLVDRPGAKQSTLYIGLPVLDPSHKDYVPLFVTNALLGGSFSSRITSNIREDKGYTYSPRSSLSMRYRDGYWVQIADVTTEHTGASLKEIFYEIDHLQDQAPSKEELLGIQNYLAGIHVLQNSSRGGIIGRLSFLKLHGLSDSYLNEYVKNIYAVTPEDVQNMANTYLRDEDMMIVVAGDEKMIKRQIRSYGKFVKHE